MAKPFINWAGGKMQLIDEILQRIPPSYNTYYEPFIGGGAVFFSLKPEKAVINDINKKLIRAYQDIKEDPYLLMKKIDDLDEGQCSSEKYYAIRDEFNRTGESHLFVWLTKHCFNGLYRENKMGLMNTPWNKKINPDVYNKDNILDCSDALKHCTIMCGSYDNVLKMARENDFVFIDSPYVPESMTANFVSYSKEGFSMDDHLNLANWVHRLTSIGVKVMLTNNDVEWVRSTYKDYNITHVDVKRNINCIGSKRQGSEVIITNY